MESVQVILVIVVVSLTILFLAVGFQVFLIMLDLRRAVKRLNSLLGGGLLRPEKLTSILEVFRRKKSPSDTREKGES